MKVDEVVRSLSLEVCAGAQGLSRQVTGGYACDLLSYVMAKAREGSVWITVQSHENVVAVANLVNLAAVIITEGSRPEAATIARAELEGVPILATPLASYEVAGRLVALGVEDGHIRS